MIRAAEKLPTPSRSPMGLDWTGRVQLAYAGAYVSLAQWDNAETAAASGRAHEPDLGSEAAGMLAAVDLCRDDDVPAAAKQRTRADRRNAEPAPIDESGGHAMAMRNIPLPALPANAAGDVDYYEGFVQKLGAETVANSNRRQQLLALLDKDADPAVKRRRDGLMARAMDVADAPEPQALFERAAEAIDAASAVHEDMFGSEGRLNGFTEDAADVCQGVPDSDACFTNEMRSRCRPAMNIAHSAWLDHVTEAYRAEPQRIELISRRMSAIGANFADPDQLQYVLASIEGDEIAAANLVVQQAYSWTVALRGFADYCVESPEPNTQPVPAKPQATGYNCPPELKALAVKAELVAGETEAGDAYALGIKVNCEEVETEGSITTLPFVNAFGSVNYSAKSGETTLVIGGKLAAGGTPVQGDFQSGVYVKFGSKGQFADVGWRIGPTIAAGTSLAEYSASDTMDLSFVEGVKYLSSADPSGG